MYPKTQHFFEKRKTRLTSEAAELLSGEGGRGVNIVFYSVANFISLTEL